MIPLSTKLPFIMTNIAEFLNAKKQACISLSAPNRTILSTSGEKESLREHVRLPFPHFIPQEEDSPREDFYFTGFPCMELATSIISCFERSLDANV